MSSLCVTFVAFIMTLFSHKRGIFLITVGGMVVCNSCSVKFNAFKEKKLRDCIKVFTIRGGNKDDDSANRPDKELILGKDRELVHFSVDLKWVWAKLTDKSTYIDFMRSSWRGVRDLAGVVDSEKEFKVIAIEILRDIRSTNSGSCIKLFQGNMKLAEWLATNTGRFILIYVEDGNVKSPSPTSVKYRHSLGDSLLGKFINDEVYSFHR